MTTDEITLLLEHATESGLARAWIVRGVKKPARIIPEPGREQWTYRLAGQISREEGGVLLLLFFPESDGGTAGVEEV